MKKTGLIIALILAIQPLAIAKPHAVGTNVKPLNFQEGQEKTRKHEPEKPEILPCSEPLPRVKPDPADNQKAKPDPTPPKKFGSPRRAFTSWPDPPVVFWSWGYSF